MFIDRNIVARAFAKAGEEPITDDEWNDATSNRVRITKSFYLATLLESLSSYDWTSQKKRVQLEALEADSEEAQDNLTGYTFMYPLPADCAKVISVNDDKPYIVEGAFLFSNEENAILLYVKNYWTGKYNYKIVANPDTENITQYYIINSDGEYEKATEYVMGTVYYEVVEEDYNFYAQPDLDPTLSAYFECKLAAAIALKLTGGTDKYQMLYNEAQFIANNAMKKSAEQARNRTKGNPWWTTQLGLD